MGQTNCVWNKMKANNQWEKLNKGITRSKTVKPFETSRTIQLLKELIIRKPQTVQVDISDITWEVKLKDYVTWFSNKKQKKSTRKQQCDISALQASEGVPIRFFSMLPELVEAYYSPNMGLVTHLQYPVQREEDVDEEPGQTTSTEYWLQCENVPACQRF